MSSDPIHGALLRVAYVRATSSHDPSSQNGALLVEEVEGGYSEVAWGYNHVPGMHGDALDMVLATRDLKYPRVIHAEVDSIAFAARRGRVTDGLTMVCPWAACLSCVGPILNAGIRRLIVHKQRFEAPYQAWNQGIVDAHAWLADAGIELVAYDGRIPLAPRILVNYQEWQP